MYQLHAHISRQYIPICTCTLHACHYVLPLDLYCTLEKRTIHECNGYQWLYGPGKNWSFKWWSSVLDKGWIDGELYYIWSFQGTIFHIFSVKPGTSQWPRRTSFLVSEQLEYICCRPLVLLVDGHSSYYCPEAIWYAAEQQIIIFTSPPPPQHHTFDTAPRQGHVWPTENCLERSSPWFFD